MRVLSMIKMSENAGQPPQELFDAMDEFLKEFETDPAVTLIDTNGLRPSAVAGVKIISTGGRTTVVDGPFTESREVIGGFAMIEVDTFDRAVDWSRRMVDLHEKTWPGWEGEIEVRQVMAEGDQPGL
jgi:hypothetical protein